MKFAIKPISVNVEQLNHALKRANSASSFSTIAYDIPWQVTNFPVNAGCRGSTTAVALEGNPQDRPASPAVGAVPLHPHHFQVYELTQS
jgi:hypothetical protein